MAEEFIDDIIGASEPVKTEAEITEELQGEPADKEPEKEPVVEESQDTNAAAGRPDLSQDEDKSDPVETSQAVKDIATQLGWREEFIGADAVDAATYILRSKDIQKSMSQHNKDLKGQLNALDGSVDALKKHNETVYKAEVKRLNGEINSLKAERRAAIELADVGKVEEIDSQIDDIQKDIDDSKPEITQKTDNPVYDEWLEENEWYTDDDEMAKFADTVAQQYVGAPLERIYALVRNRVEEVFPDRFEEVVSNFNVPEKQVTNPVGPKSPVESSSAKGAEGSFTKADLTPSQVTTMKQFVQMGIMTEDAYVKDIAKMQE